MLWTVANVLWWLELRSLSQFSRLFQDKAIDGKALLILRDVSLKEMGIVDVHRPLVLEAIGDLRAAQIGHEQQQGRVLLVR